MKPMYLSRMSDDYEESDGSMTVMMIMITKKAMMIMITMILMIMSDQDPIDCEQCAQLKIYSHMNIRTVILQTHSFLNQNGCGKFNF